jgi:hypothetical protein
MTRDKRTSTWQVIAPAIAMFVAGLVAPVYAQSVKVKQDLSPTQSDPNAQGRVRFVLHGSSDGKLVVAAHGLSPSASFDVIANGVKIGTLETTSGGNGRVRFFTKPPSGDNYLGFDPRGSSMVVRDAESGDDVLAGNVPSSTVDPTTIACCLQDDDGSECEALTSADCTAEGGTATTAATCMPDPCATTPPAPGTSMVCCIPDDSEPECEDDQSGADCADAGGMLVEATSCDPNPCAPTPPAQGQVACCVPQDGDSPECEMATPDACTAMLGTPAQGAGSCSPDPCSGGDDQGDNNDGSDNSGECGDS